jgi:hypothetical protein
MIGVGCPAVASVRKLAEEELPPPPPRTEVGMEKLVEDAAWTIPTPVKAAMITMLRIHFFMRGLIYGHGLKLLGIPTCLYLDSAAGNPKDRAARHPVNLGPFSS